jgi:hypothetical protein
MAEPKKISEVIIELNQKIDTLLGYAHNQDLLIKLLNKKILDLEKLLSNKPNPPGIVQESHEISKVSEKRKTIPGLKADVHLNNNKLQKIEENVTEDELPQENQISIETNFIGQRRTARYSKAENSTAEVKSVAVQQLILYPDKKNVCLAHVEIFNENNNLVKKVKTNAMGKWMATLDPGIYKINVSKVAAGNKPPVELSYEVEIPISDRPLELPTPT